MSTTSRFLLCAFFATHAGCGGTSAIENPALTDGSKPVPEGSPPVEARPDASDNEATSGDERSVADASGNPIPDVSPPSDSSDRPGWQLVWSDEFNDPAGTQPDPTKWGYDLGGGGWGLAQLQTYTSNAENASTDGNGYLTINALRDANGAYTSARLKTQGKFEQAFGRFEARARLPGGLGLWPAFWMLGNDFPATAWPTCGEVDIMENRASEPAINHGSLHGPGYSGNMPLTAQYTLSAGAVFAGDFHIFAVEWELNVVRFYVDDQLYETRSPADLTTQRWVYDHPFFILLNVAVGGRFPGNPTNATVFPQTMAVDYVRVYSRPPI
jgi:beta-glucanase (GH16 family)